MDDVKNPKGGASPSVKVARMITLISNVDIKTRLTVCFALIIVLMSVGTGILLWQSLVMRTQANRLKEMDEQFMEVQRVRLLVLSFRDKSEELVRARNLARLQQEAPALRNQLNDSLRQTQTVFRGIEPNNILDPSVLPTLETIQSVLPSQVDSFTTLASVGDWDALRQRVEQPLDVLNSLSAELVDAASGDVQNKRSEAARQIERAQNRTLFILTAVCGLTIVIAALLGFGITQTITRPLRSLVDAASVLASGKFGHYVPVQGRDELAHLSQVFNQTTIKLQQLYEDLRLSERELRTLIEAIPAYVGTNLPDGSPDFISESWLDYAGLSREQWVGSAWMSIIHPEDIDRVVASWRAALEAGAPVEHELRCRRADGTYHWFLYRGLPLRDDGGNIVKWYGTVTNIDALKETESALRTREHELVGIIETIPSMLWSLWPNGEPSHLSKRFLEYFGAPFEEFLNWGWMRIIHPDDREETGKAFARALETGELFNVINRWRRADGEYRWHHTMGEPLRDPDGKIIQWYGLSVDIDDRKRAEDHLRDTRIELSRASKIATVAELSASIAHELNQPLMAVLGNAQAAKRWLTADPPDLTETNSSIERILRDIRSADETMRRIRALFKSEPYEKRDESVPTIIRESLRFIREDPNKRDVQIDWSIEGSLPPICVDRIQTQQVFINLISNAIEAIDRSTSTAKILLRAFVTRENEVIVQVIDNGTGLEDTEKIFDAFITTKEKGMGIGLAVSRSIVEAHGGRIWAENNPDRGATFNVALPVSSTSEVG
jgi:PAS domain S-box-containing protein